MRAPATPDLEAVGSLVSKISCSVPTTVLFALAWPSPTRHRCRASLESMLLTKQSAADAREMLSSICTPTMRSMSPRLLSSRASWCSRHTLSQGESGVNRDMSPRGTPLNSPLVDSTGTNTRLWTTPVSCCGCCGVCCGVPCGVLLCLCVRVRVAVRIVYACVRVVCTGRVRVLVCVPLRVRVSVRLRV